MSETPIFDQTADESDQSQVEVTPQQPLEQSPPVYGGPSVDHDDEDVPAALERETEDGSGFENEHELPAEDFEGFPEPDVEDDDQ